jgi:hypothetical protein
VGGSWHDEGVDVSAMPAAAYRSCLASEFTAGACRSLGLLGWAEPAMRSLGRLTPASSWWRPGGRRSRSSTTSQRQADSFRAAHTCLLLLVETWLVGAAAARSTTSRSHLRNKLTRKQEQP